MCEHDAELVIQLVKQQAELLVRCDAFHSRAIRCRVALLGRMPRSGVRRVRTIAIRASWPGARVPPQRVGEDANRSARGADVFHFAGRDPVVDRTAADANRFAGLHD